MADTGVTLKAKNEGLRNQLATLRELADEMKGARRRTARGPRPLATARPRRRHACSPISGPAPGAGTAQDLWVVEGGVSHDHES